MKLYQDKDRWYVLAVDQIYNRLPVGNYTVQKDENNIFCLKQIENFNLPNKYYGKIENYAKRIIKSYEERKSNTGILLSGDMGSGKTLTMKTISTWMAEKNVPTIFVNAAYCGPDFNYFIQHIQQDVIIAFDEFEKVYRKPEDQDALLTLLDGVFTQKKMFIFTCNDVFKVNEHMLNRPGRVLYHIEFKGVENDFITTFCQGKNVSEQHVDNILHIASMFENFNFDLLNSMVEELVRFDTDPYEALDYLNAKPKASTLEYNVKFTVNGRIPVDFDESKHLNPYYKFYIGYVSGSKRHSISFNIKDMFKVNAKNGYYEFKKTEDGKEFHLILQRDALNAYDLFDLHKRNQSKQMAEEL